MIKKYEEDQVWDRSDKFMDNEENNNKGMRYQNGTESRQLNLQHNLKV